MRFIHKRIPQVVVSSPVVYFCMIVLTHQTQLHMAPTAVAATHTTETGRFFVASDQMFQPFITSTRVLR